MFQLLVYIKQLGVDFASGLLSVAGIVAATHFEAVGISALVFGSSWCLQWGASESTNFIIAEIYFESFQSRRIDYTEKMSLFSLVGNFGGILGLWLGVSIMTVIQLLYYLSETCLRGVYKIAHLLFRKTAMFRVMPRNESA